MKFQKNVLAVFAAAAIGFAGMSAAQAGPVDCSRPVDKAHVVKKVVYFDVGQSGLSGDAKKSLDELYAVIEGNPSIKVCAIGQADKTGDPEANKRLSLKRAESVKSYLMKKGLKSKAVETGFRGEAYGGLSFWDDTEDLEQDRRVEVTAYRQ